MKKPLISLWAIILCIIVTLSSAVLVSAEQFPDPYLLFLQQERDNYIKQNEKLFNYTPYFESELSYEELHRFSAGDTSATPDYVLISTVCPRIYDTHSVYGDFGEYTFFLSDTDIRNRTDYLIYLPNEGKLFTLEEAYYNQVEGIEEAFDRLYGIAIAKSSDANGDKKVSIQDATFIQQYVAKKIDTTSPCPFADNRQLSRNVCDANRDNKINVKDATTIQKYLAKLLVPSEFGPIPATADSVEFKEVNQGYCSSYDGSLDMIVTDCAQLNFVNGNDEVYNEEFFDTNALIYIRQFYYSGSVKGYIDGVYREGDTLYVKYREVHPWGGTDDIGVYHTALEIDKVYAEGVNKLVIENNSYYDFLGPKQ